MSTGAAIGAAAINPITAIGTAAIALGTGIYQAVASNQAAQHAKGATQAAEQEQKDQAAGAAAQSKSANDLSTANYMRDAAKSRQQQIIGGAMGRGSTILTGGLGIPNSSVSTAQKTLLGQ